MDRIGLFTFDAELHHVQPLAPAPGTVLHQLEDIHPFGTTSFLDAVAETGKVLAEDGSRRRAIVALTDGGENSSRLTVDQVTRMASEIDVPVYIIVVVSPLDSENRPRRSSGWRPTSSPTVRWATLRTGLEARSSSRPPTCMARRRPRRSSSELRHQYFIGFAPDTGRPGWHPIDVRTRQKDLVVRARSGYVAQYRPDSHY